MKHQTPTQGTDYEIQLDEAQAIVFMSQLEGMARRHEVSYKGVRVIFRVFGEGPTLVLLHGGSGSWLHWARNIVPLSQRFSVVVPDLPGFGESDEPVAPTLEALVGATQGALDQLIGANTPIALVGFSFGGMVATHLASGRPGVHHLCLLGSGRKGGPMRVPGSFLRWRDAQKTGDEAALVGAMRHNLGENMLYDANSIDALAVRIHTDSCVRARFRGKDIALGGGGAFALDKYRSPLLCAWGEHDVSDDPAETAAELRAERDNCSMHIVAGAGHWAQYERADEINCLLLEWF